MLKHRTLPVTLIFCTLFALSACVGESRDEGSGAEEGAMAEEGAAAAEGTTDRAGGPPPLSGDTITTASGLRYIVIEEGTGPSPDSGQVVRVHYTGWLTSGEKFDSSRDRGEAFAFPLGQGNVIAGWDEGIDSLNVGGQARLIIPPELAYGAAARGPIPPNSTLIFDVELMGIEELSGIP